MSDLTRGAVMARREWAEQVVRKASAKPGANADVQLNELCARLLRKEHARAVRIVKRETDRIKKGQYTFTAGAKDSVLNELQRVLELLMKGRA